MTVAITRTRAEQGLSQTFETVAPQLPGTPAVAAARRAAIGAFAALGLPHRRLEAWKYTDLRSALKEALPAAVGEERALPSRAELETALEALAELEAHRLVFVDGLYAPGLSTATALAGLTFTPLAARLRHAGAEPNQQLLASGEREAVIALNTAFMSDGAVLEVAPGLTLAKPVLLVFLRTAGKARLTTTRNQISIGAGARASLIEAHLGLPAAPGGQSNTLSELSLGKDAELSHIKVTLGGPGESHVSTGLPRLGAGASYRAFQLTAATSLVRNGVGLTFDGEGGKADVSGCFLGRGSEHIDSTLVIDHAVAGCESRELFKGVLADKARGVFQGKVIVRPNAQKTDGKQMAQVLMLSEDAEFDSKPELEINADDVVCGHGSTSADIDEDLLFYFRARGIAPEEARALLIESFIGEAIDKVEETLRPALMTMARARLAELTS
ncbi:MAG TPA: Fe-S cluster assembly protein SufD [Hyphomicrobiaceae bacterium]|nr:Fe-S cluster assembly protein SufD [Hyphomicrobiaceae bacterium]